MPGSNPKTTVCKTVSLCTTAANLHTHIYIYIYIYIYIFREREREKRLKMGDTVNFISDSFHSVGFLLSNCIENLMSKKWTYNKNSKIEIKHYPEGWKICNRSLVMQFKAFWFELILQNAALVWFPIEEEFSASVWDWCQSSIMRNLGNYRWDAELVSDSLRIDDDDDGWLLRRIIWKGWEVGTGNWWFKTKLDGDINYRRP